jgi:hypothetical protein
MTEWISVKNELPKTKNRSYLVFIKFSPKDSDTFTGILEATFNMKNDEAIWFCGLCNLTWQVKCSVTHWMPLPEPPKE